MVNIAVIGAGMMGIKIAGELACHGHRVKIHDLNPENLNKVPEVLKYDAQQLHAEGLLAHEHFLGQVFCISVLDEAVKDAELIVEAVFEDMGVKQDIFQCVSQHCKEDAIIASNTMCMDLNEVNSKAINKERTLGLRFLFPVYYIPEVEITPARMTAMKVIERVREMLEKMGKTLFFRSGGSPLVLSETQREERKLARQKELGKSSGVNTYLNRLLPNLSLESKEETEYMEKDELDRECAICMERVRDCVLEPCRHIVLCYPCGQMLHQRKDACPVCRTNIKNTLRVFHS